MATLEETRALILQAQIDEQAAAREAAGTTRSLGTDDTTTTTTPVETVSSQGVGTGVAVETVSSQGVGTGIPVTAPTTDTTVVTDETTTPTTDTTTDTTDTTTESESPEQTLEEKAASYVDQQYQDTYDLGAEVWGDELNPEYSSLQAQVDAITASQSQEMSYATNADEDATALETAQLEDMYNASLTQQAGVRDALSVSREGSTSSGNLLASSKLQQEIYDRFDIARNEVWAQQAAREQAIVNLESAQAAGRSDLVQ